MLKHCLSGSYAKKSVFLVAFMMIALSGFSRKFYFSTSGNDSYTTTQAQNSATPWKTLVKLNSFADNGAAAGDTFLFKRGDVFANGANQRGSVKWYGNSEGYTCATGTAQNPIVFTYYGDMNLERPNFLFPFPSSVANTDRYNMIFKNVSYFVFDGLQFNDIRFPVLDKRTSCYTATGLMFGESMSSGVDHFTVKNCNFSNIGYGILSNGSDFLIHNNTFTNFKSVGDTLGTFDIGADALQISGKKYRITNNYISGSWAYANPYNSSSNGLLGGALETINDFDSSFVAYNTFIDNSGGMEFGQNAGQQYGPNDDTFAYNFFMNGSNVAYVNTTGTFKCSAARLHFWNNVIIENEKSRFTGRNNGGDALGDGQTYTSSGFIFWPPLPPSKSTYTPQEFNYYSAWRTFDCGDQSQSNVGDTLYDIRNNIIWNTNGLQLKSSVARRPKDFYKNNIYHIKGSYQLATNLGDAAVLSTGERIINTKLFTDTSNAFPQNWDFRIVSDTSYAAANGVDVGLTRDFAGNPVIGNPSIGLLEYSLSSGPVITSISPTSGSLNQVVTIRGRNFTGATSVVLRTAIDASVPFTVTNDSVISATMTLQSSQYVNAPNGGIFIVTNPSGSNVSSPSFVYNPPITPTCTFVYDGWGTCNSGVQTRTYLTSPAGCSGVPPIDSVTRSCTTPVVSSLTFSASLYAILITCNVPGQLSILNSSGQIVLTLPYGSGSSTISVASLTPGTYTATTYGRSLGFSTLVKVSLVSTIRPTCRTSTNGQIVVVGSLGTAPYTYSISSTTAYSSSATFSNLRRGTYTIRCKDANNTVTSISVTLTKLSSTCN